MRLFDTMSRRKREFDPSKDRPVRIYTCGPSVYDYSHIGNFRTYLFEDILVRYLIYKGYEVLRVMNITDIEDKAVESARKEGLSLENAQRGRIRSFLKDFKSLGMLMPHRIVKASEEVGTMIRLIGRLCRKGYCRMEKDGVYFDVRRFPDYGKLRGLVGGKYLGPARKDDYSKEGLWDFRLWKSWSKPDGEAKWESPFGPGRPGWHIGCSAIAMRYLGESIDIHCGGSDNIFPHHENEIAQCECASGKRFADFWMHAKHLTIGRKKMSKRTGNVIYVADLREEGIGPRCLRYYLISERYRKHLDFTRELFYERIRDCEGIRDLKKALSRLKGGGDGTMGRDIARGMIEGFEKAMDDDLDTRKAFKTIFRMMGKARKLLDERKIGRKDAEAILSAIEKADSVLGVF